jgi:DNA-binding transcriptional LysR family regulator
MDTRFLESFVAVVENGSVAEASRLLGVTPAAIAQRIKALENEIGTRLVSRAGRNVRPTEAGAAIFEQARLVVRAAADLKTLLTKSLAGELRLGAVATAITGLLPEILTRMGQQYPDIQINIVPGLSSQLHPKVLEGDLHAALINQPSQPISKDCEWEVLREEPLIVLAPASMAHMPPHELLATQPFIRYRRNECGRLADDYLRHIGVQPKMMFELDGLDAIALMVERGLGVSLVPDWRTAAEGLAVARLPVPDQTFTRKIGLFWVRGSPRANLILAVFEQAAAALDRPQNRQPLVPGGTPTMTSSELMPH